MTKTQELWTKRVQDWKRSGLTAEAFGTQEGFNGRTMMWWQWRLGGARPRARARCVAPPVVEVVAAFSGRGAVEPFEVELRTGVKVRVPASFETDELRRLLSALEGH